MQTLKDALNTLAARLRVLETAEAPGSGGGGAPDDAEYLVATADVDLTNAVVVGPTPGGELGGTWPVPTVDAVHSGSAHHAVDHGPAQHTTGTAWRDTYQDAAGDEQEIGLATAGFVKTSAGAAAAPAYAAPFGNKVGDSASAPGADGYVWTYNAVSGKAEWRVISFLATTGLTIALLSSFEATTPGDAGNADAVLTSSYTLVVT